MPALTPQITSTLRWSSLRTELLWTYDKEVADESLKVASDHRHGYWAWLLRDGEVRLKMANKVWTAKAGQWLVSPHGTIFQEFSPGARILSVHFRCQWPTGEDLFVQKDGLAFSAAAFPHLERSASRLERLVNTHFPGVRLEFLQQSSQYPVFLKVQQRFLQWLIDFYDAMSTLGYTLSHGGDGDERLWRAAECLHASPLDAPFPSKQLQRETMLGRAQLDRLFWKAFGSSTREYWERLRQESATSSIEATAMSIKEIGYCLGFKQPSHFTKWFARRVGLTPQDYRAKYAGHAQFRADNVPEAGEDLQKTA